MQIYGLKTCDTCRKAVKALPEAKFVDIRADGVDSGLLARALEVFGERLVNKRSTTWRGLTEAERAEPPLDLLGRYPALMKRPLIVAEERLYLGWEAETRVALGLE